MSRALNVLFLCTGNSARSILSEAILNELGQGRFRAYSAGSRPMGRVNPLALETLASRGHDISSLRSKSWDEFAVPDAPQMDIVFTVCDSAAKEACPLWPGAPVLVHWGFADPSHVEGDDDARRVAFVDTYAAISKRLRDFVNLPVERLGPAELKSRLQALADEQ